MKMPYTKSGKCGSVVWQRARHGPICYLAFVPINPRTPAQVNGRAIWRAVNVRWRTLTQDQRDIWIAAARTKKSKRRLGQNGPLTGQLLFVKINYPMAYWGRGQFDLPPPCPRRFPDLAVASLSVTNVAGILKISLACPNDPGDHTILRASAPLSAGRNTCTDFRMIGLCPPPDQGLADITAFYTAKFGVPRAGSKLFLRVNQIMDGWEDKPVEFTFVVPAPQPVPQPEPIFSRPSTLVQSRAGVWPADACAFTLSTGSTDISYMGYMAYMGGRGCRSRTATGTEKGRDCWGGDWSLAVKAGGVLCLKTGHGDGEDPPLIPEHHQTNTRPTRDQHAWGTLKPP